MSKQVDIGDKEAIMTNLNDSTEELDKILYAFARNELHPETAIYSGKGIIEVAREKILKWHEQELTKARLDELDHVEGYPTYYWWGEKTPERDIAMTVKERIEELTTKLKEGN